MPDHRARYAHGPDRRELLREPVSDDVRGGCARALGGMLMVFGAIMPAGMFSPRYAALAWEPMIPLRQAVARFVHRFERDGS